MDPEQKKKITTRLPLLIGNVINFEEVLQRAVTKNLLKQTTITEWEQSKLSENEKKESFFQEITKGKPGSYAKLLAVLLKTKNRDIVDILNEENEDSLDKYKVSFDEPDLEPIPQTEGFMYQNEAINEVTVTPAKKLYGGKRFNEDDFYRMESKPRGLALVLVNEVFKVDNCPTRNGAKKDLQMIIQLFEKLNFKVFPYENQSKSAFEAVVDEFIQKPELKEVNSCMVAISSHGVKEGFHCTDGSVYNIDDLTAKFNNANCSSLKGKPKIFFIQACRGDWRDKGEALDGEDAEPTTPEKFIPSISDVFVGYSCQEGYVSHLNKMYGSWLFYAVTKIFMKYACQDDYCELVRKIHTEIARLKSTICSQKQAAEWRLKGSWKQLYFNPGL